MDGTRFTLTSRAVSAAADCAPQYVGKLASLDLVPHLIASDGTRLFSDEAAGIVRRIKAERLARRGCKRST